MDNSYLGCKLWPARLLSETHGLEMSAKGGAINKFRQNVGDILGAKDLRYLEITSSDPVLHPQIGGG